MKDKKTDYGKIAEEMLEKLQPKKQPTVYTICFNEEINSNTISIFIEKVETHIAMYGMDELRVEFSTVGGTLSAGNLFIRYLNNLNEEGVTVKLISYDILFSMGSEIFLKTTVQKYLTEESLMLLHLPLLDARGRVKEERDSITARVEATTNRYINNIKKLNLVTKKEIKLLEDGRDIYIGADRLDTYLKKHDENYMGMF